MSLLKFYHHQVKQQLLMLDQSQLKALKALDSLAQQLSKKPHQQGLVNKNTAKITQGIYLWGKVGRGKTMLMDMFYQYLPIQNKRRIHFHHFMEQVHQQLLALTGQSDPLKIIAKKWAKELDIICFDEFFVNDIGDAMLLAGLFSALFAENLVLVATSNCAPEQLYRQGLQRERFLPTISLLEKYCQIIAVNGDKDHRLKNFVYSNYYQGKNKNQLLAQRYKQITKQPANNSGEIMINNRPIPYFAKYKQNEVIWFDFFDLCSGPRSQRDYMAIAQQFKTVLISNVPQFSGKLIPAVFSGIEDCYQRDGILMANLRQLDDEARRFISLVDEFYDKKVQLIISAATDIFSLYQGEQLGFEFARCESRLVEMQGETFARVC